MIWQSILTVIKEAKRRVTPFWPRSPSGSWVIRRKAQTRTWSILGWSVTWESWLSVGKFNDWNDDARFRKVECSETNILLWPLFQTWSLILEIKPCSKIKAAKWVIACLSFNYAQKRSFPIVTKNFVNLFVPTRNSWRVVDKASHDFSWKRVVWWTSVVMQTRIDHHYRFWSSQQEGISLVPSTWSIILQNFSDETINPARTFASRASPSHIWVLLRLELLCKARPPSNRAYFVTGVSAYVYDRVCMAGTNGWDSGKRWHIGPHPMQWYLSMFNLEIHSKCRSWWVK